MRGGCAFVLSPRQHQNQTPRKTVQTTRRTSEVRGSRFKFQVPTASSFVPTDGRADSSLERGQPCPRVPASEIGRAEKAARAPVPPFLESTLPGRQGGFKKKR